MNDRPDGQTYLIYDGECPFCRRYADFVKLSYTFPGLELISAREQRSEVAEAWLAGIDLNDEMALYVKGKWYTGEKAIMRLADVAKSKRFQNILLKRLFGSRKIARWVYRRLVQCRILFLRLARHRPLSRL